MDLRDMPIGILDSGVGGLTVVRELQKLLPQEDLIYFGDNLNCPYGNKDTLEIVELTEKIFDYMGTKKVKLVVVACNTMTTILDILPGKFDYEIVGIINPVAQEIHKLGIQEVGLIATKFTVNSNAYGRIFKQTLGEIDIVSEGSTTLAKLIDVGELDSNEIEIEVKRLVDAVKCKSNTEYIILGCTHYPIVNDKFVNYAPNINFINPSSIQALKVQEYLTDNNLKSENSIGKLTIFTSGDTVVYNSLSLKLGIRVDSISKIRI